MDWVFSLRDDGSALMSVEAMSAASGSRSIESEGSFPPGGEASGSILKSVFSVT
jgi:hypothetical protein